MRWTCGLAVLAAAGLACVAKGQISPAPGYTTGFSNTSGGMGLAFVPGGGGDWLTMSSSAVEKRSSDGSSLGSIYSGLDPSGFGSFVVAQGTGALAAAGQTLAGEGYPGSIHVFRLDGTAGDSFDLAGNYDAAFDPISGMLFVSAVNGLTANALWAVQPDPADPDFGSVSQVGNIGGNSGPLSFDGDGNLYVGTSGVDLDGNGAGDFDSGIVAFNAAEVADAVADPGASLLTGDLWDVILPDAAFQSVADLAIDSDGDLIYHDYTNVVQVQIAISGSGLSATIAWADFANIASGPFFGLSNIDFLADPAGSFEPGPGAGLGGTVGIRFDSDGDWVTDSMVGITPLPEPASFLILLCSVSLLARRRSRND